MSPISCCQSMGKQYKTICYHFCCPCSTPSNPQLCMATCHWALPCPIFIPPFAYTEQRCIWEMITEHHPAEFGQEQEQLGADLEPSKVVSPDLLFLTNLIVSVTGCRITGVEMQNVKLSSEWL